MNLKEACKRVGLDQEDLWHVAKSLANYAFLEGSPVDASTCYSALNEKCLIDIADRQSIIAGLDNAKRSMKKYGLIKGYIPPFVLSSIDWAELPDERTWTEKSADYQAACNWQFSTAQSGHDKTRAHYNREERARRAYYSV